MTPESLCLLCLFACLINSFVMLALVSIAMNEQRREMAKANTQVVSAVLNSADEIKKAIALTAENKGYE